MLRNRTQAQEVSRQVEDLLFREPDANADPLIATAQTLIEVAPAAPSPAFTQNLRRKLLQAGSSPAHYHQERSSLMWKRIAAVSMAACLIVALVWAVVPRSLSAQQVLARAVKSTAAESGQIVYQVYSSQGNLYREWQRFETAPDGGLIPIETITIRYTKDDTVFEFPLEWIYNSPTRHCQLPQSGSGGSLGLDMEGCQNIASEVATPMSASSGSAEPGYAEAIDPAVRQQIQEALREAPDAPGTADMPIVETIQQQIEGLQASSSNISVVQMQLEKRPVYAVTENQSVTRADEEAVTRTLYVDQNTFLPAGISYTVKGSDGENLTWSALVLEYRILDAASLDFDPFAWPPSGRP